MPLGDVAAPTSAASGQGIQSMIQVLHEEYGEADLGNRQDPIEEFVYISLSRQTHAKNALRSWRALDEIGGVEHIPQIEEATLADLLRPSGFSNQKAKWIKESLQLIQQRFGSLSLAAAQDWDDEALEAFLRSLPGVSIKTAKCIMLYSMNRRVLPVDTHLRRLATRFGLVSRGLSEKRIHDELESLVPEKDRYSLHVNAIWHGRAVCTALQPKCSRCSLRSLCQYEATEGSCREVA